MKQQCDEPSKAALKIIFLCFGFPPTRKKNNKIDRNFDTYHFTIERLILLIFCALIDFFDHPSPTSHYYYPQTHKKRLLHDAPNLHLTATSESHMNRSKIVTL